MKLIEVIDKATENDFIHFPVSLYQDDKHWIRPLDKDIRNIFDPQKNSCFLDGNAIRWLLKNNDGKTIGRIAAFFDKKVAYTYDQPTGGIGFFECIENREAAFILFDRAKKWLEEHGMEAMDGPVNFGDRDKWWGLLVKGLYEPNYCTPYNFMYYRTFFEEYGFKNFFNQYTYHRFVAAGGLEKRMEIVAKRVETNKDYSFIRADKKNIDQYVEPFRHVYNNAWTRYKGIKEMSADHAKELLESIKPILDARLIWFGYHHDEPVAFLILIPEMNQVIKHVNGKLNLIGKVKFLYHLKFKKSVSKMLGLVFGVVEKHQRRGLEAAIIWNFKELTLKKNFPYKDIELNWIGDFNPTMMRVVEMTGFSTRKIHVTYRYLFDRDREFTRAPKVS